MTRPVTDRMSPESGYADAAARADKGGEVRPSLRQLLAPGDNPNVPTGMVHFFPESRAGDEAEDPNWPAAIELIRDVGARVRQASRFAQDVVQHSHAMIEATSHRLEETEHRLRLAEAATRDAQRRAERAESAALMADARARRAEEETELNRAKLAEAQMWLRRLYSSVQIEFRGLSDDQA